jgi:predicted Fe-Mo cluster-binding NifX family protein
MSQSTTVAVACESPSGLTGNVSGHFGHTPFFVVAEIAQNQIVSSRIVPSPGHGEGCSMPGFVGQLGVSAVVVGGIGAGAVNGLGARGIEVIAGATGNAGAALAAFAAGTLLTGEPGCHGHGSHGGGCGHQHR